MSFVKRRSVGFGGNGGGGQSGGGEERREKGAFFKTPFSHSLYMVILSRRFNRSHFS
jgi:hypothetical protein